MSKSKDGGKSKDEVHFIDDNTSKYLLEQMKQRLGSAGGFFGDKESAPTNIVGICSILFTVAFIVTMLVIAYCSPSMLIDYIKTIASIIGFPVGLLINDQIGLLIKRSK